MTLTAALLAGGESRRMGRDKATLSVGGVPLWERQLGVLRQLRPQVVWILARARPAWCPSEVEVVCDRPPSRGPLSGIAAALADLRTSHLLVLAVDMPGMTLEHLSLLRRLASWGRGVIPMSGGLFEPLCGIYPVEAAQTATTALSSEDCSLQAFARRLCKKGLANSYLLPEPEHALYLNLNTEEDLSRARGLGGTDVVPWK